MAIKPLFAALCRSPAGPLLLAAQVALGMMIFANVGYVIAVRFETTGRPTGLDLQNIFWIDSQGYATSYDQRAASKPDLEYLNSLPGVVAAAAASSVPQTFEALLSPVSPNAGLKGAKREAPIYEMTQQCVEALGLRLLYGRSFGADAIPPPSGAGAAPRIFGSEVVITKALAQELFGSADRAVGKPLYFGILDGGSATIVGVVERLQGGPYFGPNSDFINDVVLTPGIPPGHSIRYIVRARAGRRDAVMNRVQREFESLQPGRYIDKMQNLDVTAAQNRATARNGAIVLAILSSFVLAITMLGLFGFASFTIASRIREIGTRRAIGATRADILKHFLTENLLIVSAGIAVGVVVMLAFALQLSMLLELPRLPLVYLVGAMALVWTAGLLAALLPALRGAAVAPAVATRSA